jgi:hypothetical protein
MIDEMVDILKEKKCCMNNLIGIFLKYFKIYLMHEKKLLKYPFESL